MSAPLSEVLSRLDHVRQSQTNGLAFAVRRIGRKVLGSESGFIEWINGLEERAA